MKFIISSAFTLVLGDDLSSGKHRLNVSMSEDHNTRSKGNACRIVYFFVE